MPVQPLRIQDVWERPSDDEDILVIFWRQDMVDTRILLCTIIKGAVTKIANPNNKNKRQNSRALVGRRLFCI